MALAGSYGYTRLGVNSTSEVHCQSLGGFMCDAPGTFTLTMLEGSNELLLLTVMPVVAGTFYPIPIKVTDGGVRVVLAGGASGLLIG